MPGEKILSDLDRIADGLDFTRDGLGDALLEAAADGVARSFVDQTDADGNHWPELSARYETWKAKHYPGAPMGVRDGVMREGLPGERNVTKDLAVYTFGTTDEQRQECAWFSEGDAPSNRPPRPFVGLTDASRARCREILLDHLRDLV
jgi:hypothetical protein